MDSADTTPRSGGMRMAGSERRVPLHLNAAAASDRRVNFAQSAANFGSARRAKPSLSTTHAQQAAGQSFRELSESQLSATHSAAAMSSLFSEARREIRRGHVQEKAEAREAEWHHTPAGERDHRTPKASTPPTHSSHDIEAAAAGDDESEDGELDWHTDIAAMKEMFMEDKILTVMLGCVPLGIIASLTGIGGESAAFILNFIAIIPLAWLLGNATEELAMRSNQTIGGLLNASFGNAVELIVSVVALRKGMIKLVQTSLLGSILSNCLLVLGMSFFFGGLKNKVQIYNQKGAHMLSSLLLLATISLVLPAAFVNSFQPHPTLHNLLMISRVTALLMFVIYLLYLWFQLVTHSEMFSDESGATTVDGSDSGEDNTNPATRTKQALHIGHSYQNGVAAAEEADEADVQQVSDSMNELGDLGMDAIAENGSSGTGGDTAEPFVEEEDEPSLTLACALSLLIFVTLAVAVCSEFLVDSITAVTESWGMNESFVGIILIPIVGNAAEHTTAVTVAMKDKMDLAIGVAIGSSTQIALFLIPFITLMGWVINQPMSLNFSTFETVCLVMAVLMVNFLVKNGESNWLQGVMLMAVYVIIATAFWFRPPSLLDDTHSQNHSEAAWVLAQATQAAP